MLLGKAPIHSGVKAFPESLIYFPLTQLKRATFPSVEELGQSTSQLHSPSSPSETSKELESPFVSVIVTVVIFQALELVILAIQFPSSQSCPSAHAGHVSHCTH